ncbi:hypothetical protein ASE92_01000 [Pedobacter sp. Leaf41]|uniref:GxxExxY protein n=1 Tax=Pedobacter sp. Leaf41 TaxID=1736218 RepID=UPI00070360F7|nr:hypothetical protein ASE92_01000 [Pedobacter sp. Leaf41]
MVREISVNQWEIISLLIIVEVKSVENLAPVHHKQVLIYLKLAGLKLGFLLALIRSTPKIPFSARLMNYKY